MLAGLSAIGARSRRARGLVRLASAAGRADLQRDGNERVKLTNRPLQNGPAGGMGQRANAQVLDLNRDHMKLESPDLLADAKTYPILRGK